MAILPAMLPDSGSFWDKQFMCGRLHMILTLSLAYVDIHVRDCPGGALVSWSRFAVALSATVVYPSYHHYS